MTLRFILFGLIFQACIGTLSVQALSKGNNLTDLKKIQIQSISFSSRSHDWSAFCAFNNDGKISGSHISGNPPFVHEDNGRVSRQ